MSDSTLTLPKVTWQDVANILNSIHTSVEKQNTVVIPGITTGSGTTNADTVSQIKNVAESTYAKYGKYAMLGGIALVGLDVIGKMGKGILYAGAGIAAAGGVYYLFEKQKLS